MRRFPRGSVLLVAAVMATGALAGASSITAQAHSLGSPAPHAFSLRSADIPHNYKQTAAKTETAAQVGVPSITARQFEQHGYVTSYLAQFETSDGNYLINSHAYVFKTVAGAAWFEGVSIGISASQSHFVAIAVPHLGDSSHGLTRTFKQGKTTFVFYLMSVRKGNLLVGIAIGGPKGKVQLSQTVHYAQLLAARM